MLPLEHARGSAGGRRPAHHRARRAGVPEQRHELAWTKALDVLGMPQSFQGVIAFTQLLVTLQAMHVTKCTH